MADIVSKAKRSEMMSGIRGKNTKPELRVRSYLHRAGLRFRIHPKNLPGTPDIVLPARKVAILVHGCFWHRHNRCQFAYQPRSNRRFWNRKFAENVARDVRKLAALRKAGWRVITVWECCTSPDDLERLVKRIKG
jgi:DNA mismatch endonuclease (patch repair protein)